MKNWIIERNLTKERNKETKKQRTIERKKDGQIENNKILTEMKEREKYKQ